MILSQCANQVLQEFGGAMPDVLIDFEDASREFLSVRALELQKLGVSTTDVTVTSTEIIPSSRDALVAGHYVGLIPSFVELAPSNPDNENLRYKVEIVPVDAIGSYEGARAIGFYGEPIRYRLAWDAWNEGSLILWHDPIEDITSFSAGSDLPFPPNFVTYLFKKTAFNLVRLAIAKLALVDPSSLRSSKDDIRSALTYFEASLKGQCSEWEVEFRKWRNMDLNSQPHLRRTQDELQSFGYGNVTGNSPLDFIG